VFDYLDVLAHLEALMVHRTAGQISTIRLLLGGTSAAMAGNLEGLRKQGGGVNSGIQIGSIHGPVGAIAQGQHFSQHVNLGADNAELRQVLDDLTEAIRGLDRSVPDKAVALTIAQQVAVAIDAPDRDVEQTTSWWEYLGRFVNTVTALQMVSSVPALYHQAEPLMVKLLSSPPPMLPGVTT